MTFLHRRFEAAFVFLKIPVVHYGLFLYPNFIDMCIFAVVLRHANWELRLVSKLQKLRFDDQNAFNVKIRLTSTVPANLMSIDTSRHDMIIPCLI